MWRTLSLRKPFGCLVRARKKTVSECGHFKNRQILDRRVLSAERKLFYTTSQQQLDLRRFLEEVSLWLYASKYEANRTYVLLDQRKNKLNLLDPSVVLYRDNLVGFICKRLSAFNMRDKSHVRNHYTIIVRINENWEFVNKSLWVYMERKHARETARDRTPAPPGQDLAEHTAKVVKCPCNPRPTFSCDWN